MKLLIDMIPEQSDKISVASGQNALAEYVWALEMFVIKWICRNVTYNKHILDIVMQVCLNISERECILMSFFGSTINIHLHVM